MKLLLVALLALLGAASPGLASTSPQARDSCVAGDSEPFANFGTRSPYEVSGANLNSTPVGLEDCKPVHLWHLARHGTRHARQSSIESVRRRLPAIRDQIASWKASGRSIGLCDADLENILKWLPSVNASQEYQLTAQGQRDILNMGKRFRARFPGMFEGNSAANFKFRYDNTQRCIESSRWFYKGIFGEFPAQGEGRLDSLPDFYNRCPAYLIPIASDFITGDFNKFRKKSDWSEMVSRVSSRLGSYRNFDVDDIDAMYDACSYERSNNWEQGKLSPWCAAFRAEDFEVLEYWQDMREYYRTGYGHKTHAKLGCVPIKDLVKTFSERIAGKSGQSNDLPSGIIYHSHDTLINQVIAFLDLYHDKEKLRADNFNQQRNRSWRVTHFSPFASNLAAVLHECSGTKRYRVQLFLNENLLPLSDWGCDADSCTWAQFMGKFGHVLSDCKQRRLCLGL